MNASLTLVIIMVVLYAVGVYLLLERSMTRVLLGFLLVGNATNLLILIVSGPSGAAPFFDEERSIADPLPQAFILTAIVITFGVSAFLLALIYRSWRLANADVVQDDSEDLALGRRRTSVTVDRDVAGDDTEFGTRATAAVSTALNLAEQEQLEEQENIAEELRHREQQKQTEQRDDT
jgi:multisubunit Na+/H+ antiporter MnhC subunit